jgi:hypothetical protein
MYLVDLLGATLTVLALGFLLLGGYLAALRLLGPAAATDPLALCVASLLLVLVEAVGIGLLLGALGILRIDLAISLQALLVIGLLAGFRRRPPAGGIGAPLALVARRCWAIASEHWAPSLLALHAVAAEALRGLLRPPLSWDALMYHLVLAGTWLRDQNLAPVLGPIPVNYYGYAPANGSMWFWWWMAPSHSELYVNLASIPAWALLALAAGAIARELGARRHWPLAAYLVALTPTVVRFAATEYVDIFLAAALLGGLLFGLRWLREPGWANTLLFGAGLALACGTKVLGVAYALAAGGAALLLARGSWGRRAAQVGAIVAIVVPLGGYFYLRNVALGTDPLAAACEQTATGPDFPHRSAFPRDNSVVGAWGEMVRKGWVLEPFLGTTHPQSLELGVGPPVFLLLLASLGLPWLVPRDRRREGWLAALVVWTSILFWLTVPFARNRHVYANVRYLVPAIGLAFAAAISLAERKSLRDRALEVLTVALLAQGMLQLHAELPFAARVAMAVADLAAVALLLLPAARGWALHRWREVAVAALVAGLAAAPLLAQFRIADRGRALAKEFTAHTTVARFFAGGWAWLDAHAGSGNVAVVHAPNNYLTYPEMGPRLERDARYVNVNDADLPYAVRYRGCEPRVDPAPAPWLRNLARQRIRWLHVARFPGFAFPLEDQWARALPQFFALRYADDTNRVYEVRLSPTNAAPGD